MQSLSKVDIVFAQFPYEEDEALKKSRPCLVLGIDVNNERFLAAKNTTTQIKSYWCVNLRAGTDDMKDGYLRFASCVNLYRREWITYSDFEFRIGVLKREIFEGIVSRLTFTSKK